eukprot:m.29634 g.29634  ORF g.29634 m.29634 type:complete len:407 (+) comp9591_c0_seq3:132-1352(+)
MDIQALKNKHNLRGKMQLFNSSFVFSNVHNAECIQDAAQKQNGMGQKCSESQSIFNAILHRSFKHILKTTQDRYDEATSHADTDPDRLVSSAEQSKSNYKDLTFNNDDDNGDISDIDGVDDIDGEEFYVDTHTNNASLISPRKIVATTPLGSPKAPWSGAVYASSGSKSIELARLSHSQMDNANDRLSGVTPATRQRSLTSYFDAVASDDESDHSQSDATSLVPFPTEDNDVEDYVVVGNAHTANMKQFTSETIQANVLDRGRVEGKGKDEAGKNEDEDEDEDGDEGNHNTSTSSLEEMNVSTYERSTRNNGKGIGFAIVSEDAQNFLGWIKENSTSCEGDDEEMYEGIVDLQPLLQSCSRQVAASGFFNTLHLCSAGMVKVNQSQPFSTITVAIRRFDANASFQA